MPTEKTSAGFEETYRAQRLPLIRFAYLLCGSTETSEDIVQSAFASAQPRWDQIENPSSYLRRSVLNLVKDGQRRRYRLASLVSGSVTSADPVGLPPEVDETWTLIQELPWPQRAVVVLHYYEDLPLVEIAQVLKRSESTVRSDHLSSARQIAKGTEMTKESNTDLQLDQHLRHVLQTVANTVTPEQSTAPAGRPNGRPDHRRRRIGLVIGAAAIPVTLAAGAFLKSGPEYVDRIPRESIIVEGSVGGSEYLLVETRRTACGQPVKGVELVEENENLLGSEWNTIGAEYGERVDECRVNTKRYLANPALVNDGGTEVGDSMVWIWAVHPDVTGVRITTSADVEDLPVHTVDGAGYALFEVPKDVEMYTAELLINGEVVPGSAEVHKVIAQD